MAQYAVTIKPFVEQPSLKSLYHTCVDFVFFFSKKATSLLLHDC